MNISLDASQVLDVVTPSMLGQGFRLSATSGNPITGRVFRNEATDETYRRQAVAKDSSISRVVSSFKDALDVLSIGGEVSVKFNMISGSGGLEYMSKASSNSSNVDMMFKKSILTEVVELKSIVPHPSIEKLSEPAILSEFGAHYISAIYYGGSVEVNLRLKCSSSEESDAIKGQLQASVASGALEVEASVHAELEEGKGFKSENITAFAYINGCKMALQQGAAVTDLDSARKAIAEFQVDEPSPIGYRVSRLSREHLKQFGLTSLQLSAFERLTKKAGEDIMEARELFVRGRVARTNIIKGSLSKDLVFRSTYQERFEAAANAMVADLESRVIRPYFAYLDQPVADIIAAKNWPTGAIPLLSMARRTVLGLEGRGVLPNRDYLGYTLPRDDLLGDVPPQDGSDPMDEQPMAGGVQVMAAVAGEGDEAAAAAEDILARKFAQGLTEPTIMHEQEYLGKSTLVVDGRRGKYDGVWLHGSAHGEGTWKAVRGAITYEYMGSWAYGLREGLGTYTETHTDERTVEGKTKTITTVLDFYEGDWEGDVFHGQGKRVIAGEYEYEGPYVKGLRHGPRAVWKDSVSGFYLGTFADDLMVGEVRTENLEDLKAQATEMNTKIEDELLPLVETVKATIQNDLHEDEVFAELYEEQFIKHLRAVKSNLARDVLRPNKKFLTNAGGTWTTYPTETAFVFDDATEDLAGLQGNSRLPPNRKDSDGVLVKYDHPSFVGYHLAGVPTYKGKANLEGGEYDGLWMDGQPQGAGVWVGSKGESWTGTWHMGMRHGIGTYTEPDAAPFEVEYDNGNLVGGEGVWQSRFKVEEDKEGLGLGLYNSQNRGEALAEEAFHHPRCIGFNSDGKLFLALEGSRQRAGSKFFKKVEGNMRTATLRAYKTINRTWLTPIAGKLGMDRELTSAGYFETEKTERGLSVRCFSTGTYWRSHNGPVYHVTTDRAELQDSGAMSGWIWAEGRAWQSHWRKTLRCVTTDNIPLTDVKHIQAHEVVTETVLRDVEIMKY